MDPGVGSTRSAQQGRVSNGNAGKGQMGALTRTQLENVTRVLLARLQYPEMCPGQANILNAALSRIADGTYGICFVCQREIGAVRLIAVPQASFCIPCQEEREPGNMERRRTPEEGAYNV